MRNCSRKRSKTRATQTKFASNHWIRARRRRAFAVFVFPHGGLRALGFGFGVGMGILRRVSASRFGIRVRVCFALFRGGLRSSAVLIGGLIKKW